MLSVGTTVCVCVCVRHVRRSTLWALDVRHTVQFFLPGHSHPCPALPPCTHPTPPQPYAWKLMHVNSGRMRTMSLGMWCFSGTLPSCTAASCLLVYCSACGWSKIHICRREGGKRSGRGKPYLSHLVLMTYCWLKSTCECVNLLDDMTRNPFLYHLMFSIAQSVWLSWHVVHLCTCTCHSEVTLGSLPIVYCVLLQLAFLFFAC